MMPKKQNGSKSGWCHSSPPTNINLEELDRRCCDLATIYHKQKSSFSAAFDDFARDLVINDATDEEQCGKAREKLGFEKDHPFDTEVRESFHEHQCDPLFTGVDHVGPSPSLEAPPQFAMVEYTPVEYEAVEYEGEEYETIDYEKFTKYAQAAQGQKLDHIFFLTYCLFFHFDWLVAGMT